MAGKVKVVLTTIGLDCCHTLLEGLAKHTPDINLTLVCNTNDPVAALDIMDRFYVRFGKTDSRLITFSRCIGYLPAANFGYMAAQVQPDDYVALLNDDVEVHGDWITPLVAALDAGAAQVGPSVKWLGPDGMWGTAENSKYQFTEGWCWMARGETIDKAYWFDAGGKPYDEVFSPVYCEDADLSCRIQFFGGTLKEVPVPVTHLGSQTYGHNRPSWAPNRKRLIQRWALDTPVA